MNTGATAPASADNGTNANAAPNPGAVLDLDLKLPPTDKRTLDDFEKEIEALYLSVMPPAQWLLVKLDKPKSASEFIETTPVPSPFCTVLSVGPEFRHDVQPGDRITYAERLALPKELVGTRLPSMYAWIHENKYLGRLPRFAGDVQKAPRPAASSAASSEEQDRTIAYGEAWQAYKELGAKMGFDPYDRNHVVGGPPKAAT
jgi:hypothetical protein